MSPLCPQPQQPLMCFSLILIKTSFNVLKSWYPLEEYIFFHFQIGLLYANIITHSYSYSHSHSLSLPAPIQTHTHRLSPRRAGSKMVSKGIFNHYFYINRINKNLIFISMGSYNNGKNMSFCPTQ